MFGEKHSIERVAGHQRARYQQHSDYQDFCQPRESRPDEDSGRRTQWTNVCPVIRREMPVKRMSACKSISTLLLSTTILTGMSVTAFSQEAVFVGPGASWTDAGNWKAGKVPDLGTDVLIKGHQVQSTISGTTAKKITIEQGGAFIFSGTSAPAVSAKEIAVMDKGLFAFYDKTSSLKLEDQITVANGGLIGFMNDSSATNLRLRTNSIGVEQPRVMELHMGAITGGVRENL